MPETPVFAEVLLPTYLSFNSAFGSLFSTDVVEFGEGAEQRNSNWSQCRFRGNVQYAARTMAQLQVLIAFAHARRGKAQGFRFRWLLDHEAVQQFVGIGDGVTTQYQLLKIYDSGPPIYQYVHKIQKPVGPDFPYGQATDTVTLYQNSVPMVGGYTLDYTTGIVTLDSPLGLGVLLTWSGLFDHAVRFDSDTFLTSLQAILTQTYVDTTRDPGAPQYFTLLDENSVPWYFWIDTRGEIAVSAIPPFAPFENIGLAGPPSWIGVSDELTATWYLFPDTLGQLTVDNLPPAGSGINYNVPLPFPLAGLSLRGEDGETRHTIAADSRGEVYVYHTLPAELPPFDAYGMTEPIPIVGVKG